MTQTEWIISLDDDLKDYDELFVGNVRDGDVLIRCKDCKYSSPNQVYGCRIHSFADDLNKRMYSDDFCSMAERKE